MKIQSENESIEDYQITTVDDLDILEIIKILKSHKYNNDASISKKYVHSLFTPILSFIINYLNNKEDDKNNPDEEDMHLYIGKSVVDNIESAYALLDKKIYDLFFEKKKGKIGKEEINFEESDNENYLIASAKKPIEKNENNFKEIIGEALKDNVEYLLENDTIEQVFELKKKEIISTFRYGYSVQERIINFLKVNSGDNIVELPNIIFYKKNKKNKMYSEMDRNIMVKKDTNVNNFLVYLKAKFLHEGVKKMEIAEIPKGQILSLKKNSCYFIDVKTSIFSLFEKKEKINSNEKSNKDLKDDKSEKKSNKSNKSNKNKNTIIDINAPSDLVSIYSNIEYIPKKNTKIFKNMEAFKDLFEKLGIHFYSLNLVIIIDSFFPKNFIDLAKKFVLVLNDENITFDLNIYFVHFEIHIEYAHQITTYEKFNNDLKKKDQEIAIIKKDAIAKDKEINNLKLDSLNKEQEMSKMRDKIEIITKKLYNMEKKERLKKMKKEIKKEFKDIMKDEIQEITKNKKLIKEDYLIITKLEIPDFNCSKKLENINCDNVFDFKTFCLIYYENENKDLIKDVKKKHFINIKKYTKIKNSNFRVFLVDFVFLYSIKELMEYISDYNIEIKFSSNNFFLVNLIKKKNINEISTCEFLDDILGIKNKNIVDYIDMKNFTDYYLELLQIKNKENVVNFCAYNPETNGCDYFITIKKIEERQYGETLILVLDSIFYGYENLAFDYDNEKYKYHLIIYKNYDFNYISDEIIQSIPYYFDSLRNLFCTRINIEDQGEIIYDDEYKYIKIYSENNIACIFDKKEKRFQCKYKYKDNYTFDKDTIIDEKINSIIAVISEFYEKDEKITILIEEPFNFIYTYIKENYKNSNLILINNSENEKIINFLSTKTETKKVDVNIYSYLDTLKEDQRFDLIILQDNHFPNKDIDIIPKTLFVKNKKDRKFIAIRNHLKEGGKFCFNLIIKNKYLKEQINKKLNMIFNDIDMFDATELDSVVVCSND